MLSRLARLVTAHPRWLVSAWLVFVTASFALTTGVVGESLFQRLTSGPIAVNEEADEGADILACI